MSDQKKTAVEKVVLLKAHTHAGVKHEAETEISVSPAAKKWLIENKIVAAEVADTKKKDAK